MQKRTRKIKLPILILNLIIVGGVLGVFWLLGKQQKQTVTVAALAVNVRTGPGVEYEVSAQATQGQELAILKEENQWYQVTLPDKKTGWVASWLVEQKEASARTNLKAKVNTQDAALPLNLT